MEVVRLERRKGVRMELDGLRGMKGRDEKGRVERRTSKE